MLPGQVDADIIMFEATYVWNNGIRDHGIRDHGMGTMVFGTTVVGTMAFGTMALENTRYSEP